MWGEDRSRWLVLLFLQPARASRLSYERSQDLLKRQSKLFLMRTTPGDTRFAPICQNAEWINT